MILEVDHINPAAHGGDNDIMNLITSCFDCNRGKGGKKLTDRQEIRKQQEQLKELNERREQLEMMLEWRNQLAKFDDMQIDQVSMAMKSHTGSSLTDQGRMMAKKWIKEFGLIEILDCVEISSNQYLRNGDSRSINKVFEYIPRIASVRRKNTEDPLFGMHLYVSAILRNRMIMSDEGESLAILKKHFTRKTDFDEIKALASDCDEWDEFCAILGRSYGGEDDGD